MSGELPLSGIRIVDLTRVYSGPYCTFMAAMLGAEVIKIEEPAGETTRNRPGSGAIAFALLNANKRMMTLDLKAPDGAAILRELLKTADVLVENFRAGVLDRLGFDADSLRALNPDLIVARASGYGAEGLYADYPAMDLTVQAMSGVMDSTGFPDGPPVKAGPAMADFVAGTQLFAAMMVSLFARQKTRKILSPDIAMFDTVVPTLMSSIAMVIRQDEGIPARTGNRHGGLALAPYNVYPAADGHVAIISVNERHWGATVRALGRPELKDDPRFATLKLRTQNMQALDAELGALTCRHSRDALFEVLTAAGAVCAPVRTLHQVLEDEHLHHRGMLTKIAHALHGEITALTSPLRFSGEVGPPYQPSRYLSADTTEILTALGFEAEQIAAFKAKGVV